MQWYWIVLIIIVGLKILIDLACALFLVHYSMKPKLPTNDEYLTELKEVFLTDVTLFDGWKKQPFIIKNGKTEIFGDFYPSDKPSKKCAIIVHGFTAQRLSALRYAHLFRELGYNVIVYDNRYFGQSKFKYCTMGFNETSDLLCVIEHAKELLGDDAYIVLHGESMGGATVLNVLNKTDEVKAVVADCPFSDTRALYKYIVKKILHLPISFPVVELAQLICKVFYRYDYAKVSPVKVVENVDTPILFMHGKDDNFIKCENSIEMFSKCRNADSEIHLTEGAKHALSMTTDPVTYKTTVQSFLRKAEFKNGIN